ncbi:MAG: hypothetical protein HY298_25675 [Verrucomicrobia bacterium]|nr:hypothetical protein [Verrucomicrobiota bacterium]
MNKKPLVVVLAVVAIIVSGVWIYWNTFGRGPKIELDPYRALGEVAGEETARLLNHQGQVVIIARANSGGANPVQEAEVKAFSVALRKGHVGVATTERFTVPPTVAMFSGNTVPRDRFLQIFQAHPKTAALVLFAEFPMLDKPDLDLLKQSGIKIVLISGNPPGCQGLLEAGVAHLAFVPRTDGPPQTFQPTQTLRDWFNRYYVVLTPGKM